MPIERNIINMQIDKPKTKNDRHNRQITPPANSQKRLVENAEFHLHKNNRFCFFWVFSGYVI